MPYIDGSEISPDRGLYYKTEKEPYSPEFVGWEGCYTLATSVFDRFGVRGRIVRAVSL